MRTIILLTVVLAAACDSSTDSESQQAETTAKLASSEARQSQKAQPALYGTIRKPKERPVSKQDLCHSLCEHTVALKCGQSAAECSKACLRELELEGCSGQRQQLYACLSHQPRSAFDCNDAGRAIRKSGRFCRAENRQFSSCLHKLAAPEKPDSK